MEETITDILHKESKRQKVMPKEVGAALRRLHLSTLMAS